MSATVLGKRQRNVVEVSDAPSQPDLKRRTRSSRLRDAPAANPIILHQDQEIASNGPLHEIATTVNQKPTRKVPSKRTVRDENIQSSTKVTVWGSEQDENTPPQAVPQTPQSVARFRDVLNISTPSTPKHRVKLVGKPVTPRTPRTPSSSASSATHAVFAPARQLFGRSSNPGRLIGREKERDELKSFLQSRIDTQHGGCLYVSGPPGTGKSTLVEEVCTTVAQGSSVKVVKINCASMVTSKDVYGRLVEELCDGSFSTKTEEEQLQNLLIPRQQASDNLYIVTLDEMDHLLTSDLEVLYTIFEWSLNPDSRLVLIGIANALDLTDRFLPRLKSKNLKPQLLPFIPYTASQIASVITKRLQSLLEPSQQADKNFTPFMQPAAIQLCSKKVASQTGDLRKAFDIARKAIDMVAIETQRKQDVQRLQLSPSKAPLSENSNFATPMTPPMTPTKTGVPALDALTAPRASIAHVARIASAAFGNGTAQRLQTLNLHQKAALCVLVAVERRRRNIFASPAKPTGMGKAPTVKQIYETYAEGCKRDNMIQPLSATEFRDIIGSLETLGLIGEGQKAGFLPSVNRETSAKRSMSAMDRNLDDKRIVCFVAEKEVNGCVSLGAGEGILKFLLNDA